MTTWISVVLWVPSTPPDHAFPSCVLQLRGGRPNRSMHTLWASAMVDDNLAQLLHYARNTWSCQHQVDSAAPRKKSNINHEFRKGNILTVYFIEQKALGLHFARLVFWMATSTKFSLVSTCLVLGCFKHRNPSSTFSMQFDALLHGWKWHSRLSTEVRSPRSLSVSSTAFSREA